MSNINDETRPPPGPSAREGAEQVRGNRRYRFTNGQWVYQGLVVDQSNASQPNVPGGKYGSPVPNAAEPVIDTAAGPFGAVMYAPDAKNKGYITRYVWDAAKNAYVAERVVTAAEWTAIQGGTGDGKFYGDTTHEYGPSSDGNMVDRTLANDIYNRTNPPVGVVPDPGGQRIGTGQGVRAADTAAVAAGTSVRSGRTGTGPIVTPVATPAPRVYDPRTERGPWRPKPTRPLKAGNKWVWNPVSGQWGQSPVSSTPSIVPPPIGEQYRPLQGGASTLMT
jgi:hypothetical protein